MSATVDKKISRLTKYSFGVGHILNDLSASMWFSYLLVYLHQVRNFNNKLAGNLMLIGQVSDALATPFIGYESDRSKGFCKMGKRKSWHFLGTICVLGSFAFLFIGCITCDNAPDLSQFVYYIPFVVIFQFGWAATQISHLALIPELTPCESERVGLNGLRYGFTVLSNLTVYGVAWALFALGSDSSELSAADAPNFRNLVFIVLGGGSIFSLIFHLGTKEPEKRDNSITDGSDALQPGEIINQSNHVVEKMTIRDWFREPQFYMVGVLYMGTRLYVNLSQVYLPMYLVETLSLGKTNIAIVPLIVYVSGFFTSIAMKPLNKLAGRKATYLIGVVFACSSCVWIYFISADNPRMVFGAAVLMGIGGTTMLVTSLALVADLIGENTESSAFVFGAMSFTDKLSNGVGVEIIQICHPCLNCCPLCIPFYRSVQSIIPGVCAILAAVMLGCLIPQKIGQRRRDHIKALKPIAGFHSPYNDEENERKPLLSSNASRRKVDGRIHTSMNTPPEDVEEMPS